MKCGNKNTPPILYSLEELDRCTRNREIPAGSILKIQTQSLGSEKPAKYHSKKEHVKIDTKFFENLQKQIKEPQPEKPER